MQQIQLLKTGQPDQVCACIEVQDPGPPSEGQIVVAIEAAAINPADLLIMEGRYPGPTELPAAIGIEGAGVVLEIGGGVTGLTPGDKVISLGRSNWSEKVRLDAGQVVKVPNEIDIRHAAMLKANPPSAMLMLRDYVDMEPGDWVIQNAANSAVGRHVIRLARARGLRSIGVVRRETLVAELKAIGADVVVVGEDRLAERVRAEAGIDARIRLAIDAIGGKSCENLADCLSDGGTVVNYGFLSGESCSITPHQLIIHGLSLHGFWLVGFMREASRGEIEALYGEMAELFMNGTLDVPIEASYGLADISEALAHAMRQERSGKILLSP